MRRICRIIDNIFLGVISILQIFLLIAIFCGVGYILYLFIWALLNNNFI